MQISNTYVDKHKGVSQRKEKRREVKEIDRKIKDRQTDRQIDK